MLTGADVIDGWAPTPMAFTGDSWFTDVWATFNVFPTPPRELRRYPIAAGDPGPVSMPLTGDLLATYSTRSEVAFAADRDGALLATLDLEGVSPREYHLDLFTFATGKVQRLLETTDVISSVALNADTLAWDRRPAGAARQIVQRPRAGGTTRSYTETNPNADAAQLVAGVGQVGYLVPDPTGMFLRVVTGDHAAQVGLPRGGSGLAAVGRRFLTATGGSPSVAGVYSVDGKKVRRVATVPSAPFSVQSMAFSGSQLYYTDESHIDEPGLPLWRRTVSGRAATSLRAERLLIPRAAGQFSWDSLISFSAGRGAVGLPGDDGWQLLDRGAVTA